MLMGMGESRVRAAGPQDIDAIVALHRDFHAMHVTLDSLRWRTAATPADVYPRWLAELIADERLGVVLVAESAGEVVGYLIAEVEAESTRHWSPASVYLHDVFVVPASRGHGSARRMVDAMIAWRDRTHAALPLRLTTAASNEPARRFFESLGFRAAAVEMMRP
jgi:GNAT superfamily N-acetyltransferase